MNGTIVRMIIAPAVLLACGAANAGEIYGRIVSDSGSVNAAVVVVKVNSEEKKVKTDEKRGSYRVVLKESGTGTIEVEFKDEKLKAEVASYDRSVRYDFEIVKNEEGKYELKRK